MLEKKKTKEEFKGKKKKKSLDVIQYTLLDYREIFKNNKKELGDNICVSKVKIMRFSCSEGRNIDQNT